MRREHRFFPLKVPMPRAAGIYAGQAHVVEHDIEALIDSHGLANILDVMSTICFEKAEHMRSNWQDSTSARAWDQVGKALNRAARDKRVKEVS